ncbi:dynamin family protein [Albidovulum aquaemixtae]|nr:dynamin family protein [Defluviimonas aquaemixtae]
MGEFSAGKSTLANLLMSETFSQVQVTATQMPPVWYAHGEGPAVRIAVDGTEEPLDAGQADAVTIRNTRAIRKFVQADILEVCDIIDMPGSSDPNITENIWQSMLPLADAVVWCTPATQAWRQSEAAMWEEAPEHLFPRSLLLITRIDKVLSEADRRRLVSRVQREAGSMFREVLPVSLVEVQDADGDPEAWQASGLEAVLGGLQEIIAELERVLASAPRTSASDVFVADRMTLATPAEPAPPAGAGGADEIAEAPGATATVRRFPTPHEAPSEPTIAAASEPVEIGSEGAGEDASAGRVMPRRVQLSKAGEGRSRRPRSAGSASLI